MKNEFRYLKVRKIGLFMVTDVFDCAFECLRLSSCISVNLAKNEKAAGNIWCELLSSDKYQNSQKFRGNQTSHHLFKKLNVSEELAKRGRNLRHLRIHK